MHPPACIWEACWTCLAAAGFAGHLLAICWYHGAPLAMASVAVLLPAIVTIAVTVKRCLASISIAVYCALGAWVSMTLVYTGKIVAIIVYADAIFTIGVVVQEKLFTTFVYAEATLVYWYNAASHTGNCQALLIWLAARGLTGLGSDLHRWFPLASDCWSKDRVCLRRRWLLCWGRRGGPSERGWSDIRGAVSWQPLPSVACRTPSEPSSPLQRATFSRPSPKDVGKGMADHAPACSPSQLECQAA